MSEPYAPPLDQLLTLGDTGMHAAGWDDYTELGIGPEHVPELIRMACDPALNQAETDDDAVFAPVHAWRALAHLRPPEAAEPLVRLLRELADPDDWARSELPQVLARIGAPAFPALTELLAKEDADEWTRAAASAGLKHMARYHPELRDPVVATITGQLSRWRHESKILNSCLIGDLADMHVEEAAPLIEQVFAGRGADETIVGDWEDIQVELGLLAEPTTLRPSPIDAMLRALRETADDDELDEPTELDERDLLPVRNAPTAAQHAKNKAKKKAEKKARKKNRRR